MAQTARPIDVDAPASAAPASLPTSRYLTFDEATASWSESPVRELHQQLVDTFALPEPQVEKLPLRTRALVIAGAVVAPWAVIAAGFALLG